MDKNYPHNDHPEKGNLLDSISKKELFEAPQGYFDALPGEVMNRILSAPTFYAIEKQAHISAPEGYAEDLHNRVMATIKGKQETKTVKIVSLPVKMFRWTAVAASMAILFTVGYHTLSNGGQNGRSDIQLANSSNLTPEDYQHYLENEINIDDAIAYYVNEQTAEGPQEQDAELNYLIEEEFELENY